MKKIGAILLAIGAILTILISLNFSYSEDDGNLESDTFQISPRHTRVAWSPLIGVAVMVIGGGVYLLGVKKVLMQPDPPFTQ